MRLRFWEDDPETRRHKAELRERKRKAYQEGLAKGRIAREERELQLSQERGYRKGAVASKPFYQKLIGAGKALGKGAGKLGKDFSGGGGLFKIPENDPFGFGTKRTRKKRKRKRRKK